MAPGRRSPKVVTCSSADPIPLTASPDVVALSTDSPSEPSPLTTSPNLVASSTDSSSDWVPPIFVKRRGKSKNCSLNTYRSKNNLVLIEIEILPGMWKPVNGWSKEWTTELGIQVRQHAPYHKNWKHILQAKKELIYKIIKGKFKMRYEESHIMRCIDKQLKKQLKDFRCRLHRHFLKFSPEEVHSHPYKSVTQENWDLVCNRFMSEQFKRASKTNKKNKEKNKVPHRGGSKSFVRCREELRDAETQQLPSRIKLYEKTHFHPDKGWSCPRAKELYGKKPFIIIFFSILPCINLLL
ncbi:uncharacterized protein LOC132295377 isoform X2 [Cornus florida]|uniref:uncharacterized protein LOC132295377 isoform X2 n=1 Tax=Cornus florida TaxID=4283 RepID=UPI0028A13247|nr:uncharacterized protein LOC132295377 isoform X2 [Cornus florida]XP_059649609.1 uncharacterized protein LOC132295377 isoform X2 [Cornus florida]XP_059649610.1 uncharacterized protein LOC132295377 isoform X2 [Cornus florida]XP_059649611.1 uncharacterized protein LOC132295377 isoform X2 [Cornus florida]